MTDHPRLNADSTRHENQSGSITDGSQVILRPEDNRVITNARSGDSRQVGGMNSDSTALDFGDSSKLFSSQTSGGGKGEAGNGSFQDGISATESGASRTLKYDGANLLKADAQTIENERSFGPARFQLLNTEARYVKAGETMRFPTSDEVKNVSDTIKVDTRSLNRDLTADHMSQRTADQFSQKAEPPQPGADKAPTNQPGDKAKPAESPARPESEEYTVKPGDNLSRIAREHLGTKDPAEINKYIQEMVRLNGWKDGASHKIQPGDRVQVPTDKNAEVKPDSQHKQEQREKLEKLAEEKFKDNPEKLAEFKENMRRLEGRAAKDGLSDAEVAKTFKETSRLLEAQGNKPLSPEKRLNLAEQVMRQAADPTTIDQGNHNTCNMATVESRMYTKNPSDAAKLVADVALTGQYTTKDGIRVRVNPNPHDEARNANTIDGERSHASEIFQVTSVNIHVELENRKTHPRGNLRYEQHPADPSNGDTGERIIDYGQKPPQVVDFHPQVYGENAGNLRDVYRSITGKDEKGIVVGHADAITDPSDGVKTVTSEQELNDYLAQAKKDGKLPLIVGVDTRMEPFWTDSKAGEAGGSGGKHVVTITDYQPGPPPKVTIDNQWGKGNDHDASKPVSVSDLYKAMRNPDGAADDLKKEADASRAAGHPDLSKETEVARLMHQSGKMTNEDYEKEMIRISRELKGQAEGPERDATKRKLQEAMNNLGPGAAFRVMKEQHDIGLLGDQEYTDRLKREVGRLVEAQDYVKANGTPDIKKEWKPQYEEGVRELMKALEGLPPETVKEIRESIAPKRKGR